MTTSLRSSDNSFLDLLLSRRSVKPAAMAEPGPVARLNSSTILTAASRVPDHKKLDALALHRVRGRRRAPHSARCWPRPARRRRSEPPSEVRLETERTRLLRAPMVIGVVISA